MRATEVTGIDAALALFARRGVRMDLAALDRRDGFTWRTSSLAIGAIVVAVNDYGGAFASAASAPSTQYSLAVARSAAGGVARDGEEVEVRSGRTAWLASPGSMAVTRWATGLGALHLIVPAAEVSAAVSALSGRPVSTPPQLARAIAVDDGPGAALVDLLEVAVRELARGGGALASPVIAARYMDAVVYALVASAGGVPAAPTAEPREVRVAAEYLERHAGEPLRMREVAAAVGVGLRALQLGFRRHRGQTLAAFLHERRLQLARARLLGASVASVTEVALGCGFAHLGRFSAQYRARFGESPSETARRART